MTHDLLYRSDVAELLARDMQLSAQSWNAEARPFEVIVSSGAGVVRRDARGVYTERIDVNQDWSALRGAPVLNSHQRNDIKNILGSVIAVRVTVDQVVATIRMSKSPEGEAAVQAALEGHLRGVSFGYKIDATKESTEGGRRVVTVTRLTPVELSLVPVGADPAATTRGSNMDPIITSQDPPAPLLDRATLNAEIRSIARISGLPQTWVDAQIDGDSTVEAARAGAFEAMQARSAAAASIRVATASIGGHDASDPEWRRATIGEALHVRMSGGAPSEQARPFVGLSMIELARDALHQRNLSTTGSPSAIVERALSTSDLPLHHGRRARSDRPASLRARAKRIEARLAASHRARLPQTSSAANVERSDARSRQ